MRPRPTPFPFAVSISILAFLVATACTGCTSRREGSGAAGAVPAPLAPPSADVVAYVAVRSLDAALQGAADVAKRAAGPDEKPLTAADLKAEVGGILGDPQLASLDASKPIVIAVLKAANAGAVPPFVALIPAKENAPYAERLAAMGMQARFADGLLAVAQTPEALGEAAKARAVYDRIVDAKLARTARLFVDADSLAATYRDAMKAGVAQIGSMAGQGGAGDAPVGITKGQLLQILLLEVLGLLSVLEQSDAIQIDAEWGAKGFDFDFIAAAKPGSALAGLFTKSAALRAPLESLLPTAGAGIKASIALDPAGLDGFLAKVMKDLAADPEAARYLTPETIALMTSSAEAWKGTGVLTLSVSEKAFSVNYELDVVSAEKFIEMLERSFRLFSPGSPIGDLYKGMGIVMTPSLEKNARQHSGVPIHRYKAEAKLEGPLFEAAGQSEFMKTLLDQRLEVAVAGGRAFISQTPAELDRMIDAALAQKEGTRLDLEALEVFGEGGQGYFDYEVFGMLKFFAAMMPASDPEMAQMTKEMMSKLSPTKPMTSAMTFAQDRARLQLRFPMEIIEGFSRLKPR